MFDINWKLIRSTIPQFIAVLSVTSSAVFDGIQYGWSSPIIPMLERPDSPVKIVEADKLWLEIIYMLGGLFGLPITAVLVDKIGRKYTIFFAAYISVTASLMIAFAKTVYIYYAARFITGLAGDCAFVAVPMYIAEIADQKVRGFLSALIYVMMLVGLVIVYAIAPYVSIEVTCAVGICFLCVEIFVFPFMPDSPYFLLLKNKKDEARKHLQRLRAREDVDEELEEIQAAVIRQNAERGKPKDLFLNKGNRTALIILVVLNWAQQFSSFSVILMNLHTILADAGPIISANPAAIIFSVVMLISSIISSAIVDKYGRKALLISSSIVTGLSLLILATYFAFKNNGVDVQPYNWVPILAVLLYAISFKLGLGMVPIIMTAEFFPTSVKAIGMTIADGSYVLGSVVAIFIYSCMTDYYGIHAPFFLFATSCFLTTIFVIFVVPETKGKTLEEIQFILKGETDSIKKQEILY